VSLEVSAARSGTLRKDPSKWIYDSMKMHQKSVLPFSETWTGWKVGQRGT